jgi:hypothetical protein
MFNIKIKASTSTELQNALMSLTDAFRMQTTPQTENKELSDEAKPRRGRPPKAKEEPASEAPEQTLKAPTRDDVIAALTAFSDAPDPLTGSPRGQIKARQMMQTVTNQTRLIDVDQKDYPKLIAALTSDNAA